MPTLKPTCGYPSQKHAIHALAAKGKSREEIAEATGVTSKQVQVTSCQWFGKTSRVRPDLVLLPPGAMSALRP